MSSLPVSSLLTLVISLNIGCDAQSLTPDAERTATDGKADGADTAATKTLIGRCAYDAGVPNFGFRAGNALASIYRVEAGSGEHRLVVAHGLSVADGSLYNMEDTVELAEVGAIMMDQGILWPTYELSDVLVTPQIVQGHWIDNLARQLDPAHPAKSGFAAQLSDLGQPQLATGVRSLLQDVVVGRPNIYPGCVFWEVP